MRGRARILDSRYIEFIEYLQKLGELQSITRMITDLSYQENEAWKRSEAINKQQDIDASKMMYSFWQRGWIEIREIEKKRENGQVKEYIITVSLKKIVEYLFSGQKTSIPA